MQMQSLSLNLPNEYSSTLKALSNEVSGNLVTTNLCIFFQSKRWLWLVLNNSE